MSPASGHRTALSRRGEAGHQPDDRLFSPDREADFRTALEKFSDVKLVRWELDHARTVVNSDPEFAFQGTKPEKKVERCHDLLGHPRRHTPGTAPPDPTPEEKFTRLEPKIRNPKWGFGVPAEAHLLLLNFQKPCPSPMNPPAFIR